MPTLPQTFLLAEPPYSDYASSRVVVWPVPYERTTSYRKGTSDGPAAILHASHYVETWDEELGTEPLELGIATAAPFLPEAFELGAALDEIGAEAERHLRAGKFLVTLGGEHGLTSALVFAARRVSPDIGVVQFDAHADLRAEYEGTRWSHASVMRRIVEAEIPTLAVGLRALSRPEADLIAERDLPVIWGRELEGAHDRFVELLARLPDRIYLTFDVDYFDPALVPATGTPEPGGGTWYPTLGLLRTLFEEKTVVAMDAVELAPIGGLPSSDFVTARLVYKCLAYLHRSAARPDSRSARGACEGRAPKTKPA